MERQELVAGDAINFKSEFRPKSKDVATGKKQVHLPNLNMVNKCYDKIYRNNKNFKKRLISTLRSDSQILQSSQKTKKRKRVFRPYPCRTVFNHGRKPFYKHRRVKIPPCSTESCSESSNEDFKNTLDTKLAGNTPCLFESEPVLPSFSKSRTSHMKNETRKFSRTVRKKTLHTVPQDSSVGEVFGNLFIKIAGKVYCAKIQCTNVTSYLNLRSPFIEKVCERKHIKQITPKEGCKEVDTFSTKSLKNRPNEFINNPDCGYDAELNLKAPSIDKALQTITEKVCNKLGKSTYPKSETINQRKLIVKDQPKARKDKGNYRNDLPNAYETVLHQKNDTESFHYSESENDSGISLIQQEVHEKNICSNKFHTNNKYIKNNKISKISLVGNAGNNQPDLCIRPNLGKVSKNLPEFTSSNSRNSNSFFVHKIPKDKISEEELWEKFEKVFRSYARTKRHAGEVIPRKISLEWMTQAGVVNNLVSEMDADEGFRQAAGSKVTLNAQEYKDFLIDLTIRKKLPFYEIYRRMCGL